MQERPNGYKDVIGRRVDFTQKIPLAWGVEIDLAISNLVRNSVLERSGIKIPKHIDTIKFLDLNPQESLPVELRNIRSDFELHEETILNNIVSEKRQIKVVGNLFKLFFWKNEKQVDSFNKAILNSKGKEIVIIEAHGDDDLFIGEQFSHDPETVEDQRKQSEGNQIEIRKVFKRYGDRSVYSAVMLISCYMRKKTLNPVGIPLVYVSGVIEHLSGSSRKKYNTNIVIPKNW